MYTALLLVQLYGKDKKQRGCGQESQDKADMPDSCPVKTEWSSWEPTHDLNRLKMSLFFSLLSKRIAVKAFKEHSNHPFLFFVFFFKLSRV